MKNFLPIFHFTMLAGLGHWCPSTAHFILLILHIVVVLNSFAGCLSLLSIGRQGGEGECKCAVVTLRLFYLLVGFTEAVLD